MKKKKREKIKSITIRRDTRTPIYTLQMPKNIYKHNKRVARFIRNLQYYISVLCRRVNR